MAGAVWRRPMLLARKAIRRPSGAVARRLEVPGGIDRHRRAAGAGDVDLRQRPAVVEALLRRRIEDEGDVPAVRGDVEDVRVRVHALQLEVAALEQVDAAAAGDVEHVQVGDPAHRQVAVPVAVLRFRGDVAAFLALLPFLPALGLGLGALQLGPDPGDEGDATAVGEPLERLDPRREIGDAARLAAVGRDQVELRRVVLLSFLLALGEEGDRSALGRPGGLAVLLAAGGEAARLAAEGGEQPEAGRALVLLHRVARHRADGLGAVGRERDRADALDAPQRLDVHQPDLALRHSVSPVLVVVGARGRACTRLQPLDASLQRSCALASGHSPAVMLYITVSRTVPSRRRA